MVEMCNLGFCQVWRGSAGPVCDVEEGADENTLCLLQLQFKLH